MSRSTIMLKFCPFQDSNDSLSFQHKLRCQTWYMYGILVYGRSSKDNEYINPYCPMKMDWRPSLKDWVNNGHDPLPQSETHWLSSTWERAERLLSQMSLSEELGEAPKNPLVYPQFACENDHVWGMPNFFRHRSAFALLLISRTKCLSFSSFSEPCSHPLQQVSYFLNRPQRFHLQGGRHNVASPRRDLMRERLMLEWGFITCYSGSSPINENAGHQNKAAKPRSDLQIRTTLWHLNFNLWVQIMRNDRFQFQKLKTGKRGFSSVKPAR